jgi:sugar phosphate isomerase/epimerase
MYVANRCFGCHSNGVTTRRDFLASVAAATAASTLPSALSALSPAAIGRIGRIGLQLYTLRAEMRKSVDATFERVAAIGYKEVEFAGYFNRDPAELRAKLDALGLTAPACHLGLPAVEAAFDATAAAAKTIGHRWLIVASVPGRDLANVASIKSLAVRFNEIGKRARDAGLRFGYHNHNVEFKSVEGVVPYDILVSETDAALVDFEMDIYWITQAGHDPLAYFAKYPGRFKLVHVKDSAGPPSHAMRDVGAGSINWKAIFAKREQAGIGHYIVEHDDPADPYASITASYNYLHALKF